MCAAATEVTIPLLQKHLRATLDFLTPFLPMANGHMVTYLTECLWDKHVPADIRQEIQTESNVNEAMEVYWKHLAANAESMEEQKSYGQFRCFLSNAKQYYLDRFTDVWITPDELNQRLHSKQFKNMSIKGFMNEKKNHEVSINCFLNCIGPNTSNFIN